MKPFLFLALTACSLCNALASDLNFKLLNQTTLSFEAVYLTASTNKDWDGNLLTAGKALASGRFVEVIFEGAPKISSWDLNVVDEAGVSVVFKDLNLIDVETITLKETEGKVTAVVE